MAWSGYMDFSRRESKQELTEPVLFDDEYRFRPGVVAGGRSFSTQDLIGCGRGGGLSGFACTFFGLARGIGVTRFYLFCPSAIESFSACYHKNILLLPLPNLFRYSGFQGN